MAEIQKIVTSAGWLDQCPDESPPMDCAEIEPEVLPSSQWDAAVQEKQQQVLEGIKHFLHGKFFCYGVENNIKILVFL
jgi:hypothetical protein